MSYTKFFIPLLFFCLSTSLVYASSTNAVITTSRMADGSATFNGAKLDYGNDGKLHYNNTQLNLQLNYDGKDKCSSTNSCSKKITFGNLTTSNQYCSNDIEQYQFCSARDFCSKLLWECIDNQVQINNNNALGKTDSSLDAFKTNCNTNLLSQCNKKFGITKTSSPDFLGQININATVDLNYQNFQSIFNSTVNIDPTRYGWFNEICVVKGFESSLKEIVAYNTIDGVLGKCKIVGGTYYESGKCTAGGKAPYCICEQYVEGKRTLSGDETHRTQTPREAGLCVDVRLPNVCPAIDYGNNPPDNDKYTKSSTDYSIINQIFVVTYSNNGIHTSHQSRSSDQKYGHGEFLTTLEGSKNVAGSCNGFWKAAVNNNGINTKPTLDCVGGEWKATATNTKCIRYSCPQITTKSNYDKIGDANDDNSYKSDYALGESYDYNGDKIKTPIDNTKDRGYKYGFALWPQTTKANDFLEKATATQCLTGFKKSGSTFDPSSQSFTGGTLPTRFCDQTGHWEVPASLTTNNSCQRIMCPGITIASGALKASPLEAEMKKWYDNGGAQFPETPASRSSTKVLENSISTGKCNNDLGFLTYPGTAEPTRDCNYLGQWGPVKNPCVSECKAIPDNQNSNDGYALWDKAENVPINGSVAVKYKECSNGYILNPNAVDSSGNPLIPTRNCQSVATNVGYATVWGAAKNGCINQCPAGTTLEKTSSGNKTIDWQATDYGKYAYSSNCDTADASSFVSGRSNGCYLLRRFCGDGNNGTIKGKWEASQPMCVTGGGTIDNATYSGGVEYKNTQGETKSTSALVVNATTSTGTCSAGFFKDNSNNGSAPQRQCLNKSVNNNVDEVYLELVNNTKDCKRYCSISANKTFGNSIYNGSIKLFDVGAKASLVCQTGFIKGTPSITCNSDGIWSAVATDCVSKPKNCYYPGSTTTGGTTWVRCKVLCFIGGGYGTGNYDWWWANYNWVTVPSYIENGITTPVYYTRGGGKYCWRSANNPTCESSVSFTCNDGRISIYNTPDIATSSSLEDKK